MKSNCKVSQQIVACSNMIIMIMRYYQQGYLTGQNVGKCREFHELCYYRPLMSSAFVSLPFVKKLILYDFLVSLSAIYAKKRRLLVY